ncbi:MAG TPA: family 16 glycoside hydrolase [Mucilaginibacter sp.]|nr:family 16 glycoside hydrolase [Mucilaginibacter sp.]
MKKIFYTIILLSGLAATVNAQSGKISAILDKEPANNEADLNANAAATAQLGEQGISEMLAMLQTNGTADNTRIYDAISGFSFCSTQPGKEAWRNMAVQAYVKALPKAPDAYNQAFIISQLQTLASDASVPALKNYLADKRLCDPAARALVKVGTPAAKVALRSALRAAKDSCQLSIVEALGDIKDGPAAPAIGGLIGKDKNLDKVCLYALAQIGSPASSALMSSAAKNAGYSYDETDATSSYILYLKNLSLRGTPNKLKAEHLAKSLWDETNSDKLIHTHTAALRLLADLTGGMATGRFVEAAKSSNAQYRAAAMEMAGKHLDPQIIPVWTREFPKGNSTEKVAIITMLGDHKAVTALPAINKELRSTDTAVVIAAVTASGKLGQNNSLDNLLEVLKNGNKGEDMAVQNALLTMKGAGLPARVGTALPDMPASGQPALINFLAARRAHAQIDLVTPLLKSGDPAVRAAAYGSLKQLAGRENLNQLFSLLAASDQASETAEIQEAIIAVFAHSDNKAGLSAMVLPQMGSASADRKTLYFNILAAVGDKPSLNAVSNAFDTGDAATKQAAITALSQWADLSAAPELLVIARKTTDAGLKDQALKGYVNTISGSNYPPEEKVIYLRDAMEVAQTVPQKKMILEDAGDLKVFPALVFESEYLDNPALQLVAANALSNIALSDKNFYGDAVKQWLNKAILIKKGGDADYEKVAIRKFIAEMPADPGLVPLFNNRDLSGWKGLVGNPITRSKMDAATLAREQAKADSAMRKGWYVKDSVLNFSGDGENLCTTKQYRNFEMYVDWKIEPKGDAGIYLRGSPQVQIWDTSRVDVGAQVGSGGLYNNQAHQSKPLKLADNAINDWNNFHIIMKDDRVTVYLNGVLVVDNVVMDNYWDRSLPIFPKEQIELQAHGTHVYYRDIYIRELPD